MAGLALLLIALAPPALLHRRRGFMMFLLVLALIPVLFVAFICCDVATFNPLWWQDRDHRVAGLILAGVFVWTCTLPLALIISDRKVER